MIPIGTFTKKIQCQLSDCVSAPREQPNRAAPAETERVHAHRLRLLDFLGGTR